jgi:hypothetical protein
MVGFERRRTFDSRYNTSLIGIEGELDNNQIDRLKKVARNWNFFEGYHWEELEAQDKEITVNYCRTFVNKFVAFELGKAFTFNLDSRTEKVAVHADGRDAFKFLEDVWVDNNQYLLSTEIGQMKSVTGEAWVQVRYLDPDELEDPYGEYEEGRIKLMLMHTSVVFPEYDPHDKDILTSVTVMYMYERVTRSKFLQRKMKEQVLYKQVWTKDECIVFDGKLEPQVFPNKYGVIPFVQIKNLTIAGTNDTISDLDDIIPLNTEYNMKEANISEIIDYHSAPVTIVYGAKIGNLEKGANKLWGGLAKDAKVENLGLTGDLGAAYNNLDGIRLAMCEVGNVPEAALGGSQSISNTSGVALQYQNLPLIEKTRLKRQSTEDGIERLNKLILLIAISEGLIVRPESIPARYFFFNEVDLPDTLPKDELLELQQIQIEMTLGLLSRRGALKRMGKEKIEELIAEIDEDMAKNPTLYGKEDPNAMPQLNSGMTNGQTPDEQMNIETTGENKKSA